LKEAVCAGSPQAVGLLWANWCWKAVSEFLQERFGIVLGRTACIDWLHRLGFVRKRPGKRLLKADVEKRTAFVSEYRELLREAKVIGAKIFFVDEAHFRADVELRLMWSLRGEPALVASTSPRRGEKATYYSAVCLETGEIEAMSIAETCTAETTVAFLKQLRAHHKEPLIIIWDNGPAHRGPALRTWLSTPNLRLRLVPLPAYSPDFNADEAVWDWVREEATANLCFGTKDKVEQAVDAFFARLTCRTDEAKRRCRTLLQAQADNLPASRCLSNVDPIPVSL
jgi:transposase